MKPLCADALVVIAARTPEAFAFRKTSKESSLTTRQFVWCWGWFRTWDVAIIPQYSDEEDSPQEWGEESLVVGVHECSDDSGELDNLGNKRCDDRMPVDLEKLEELVLEESVDEASEAEQIRDGGSEGQEKDDLEGQWEVVDDE